MKIKTLIVMLLALCMAVFVNAQIDVKGKVKGKAQERADQRTDEGIDRGIDKVEEGIGNLFKKKNKKKNESNDEQSESEATEEQTEDEGKPTQDVKKKQLVSTTQYDFVPGDKILFFDDFSQDAIGDFPALWTTNGSGEVKTLNIVPGKWFHMNGDDAVYCYTKALDLPANFIVEFDIVPDDSFESIEFTLYNDSEPRELNADLYPGVDGLHIRLHYEGWFGKGYREEREWMESESNRNPVVSGVENHVIIWIQNRRLRIYHQGAKVMDAPTIIYGGTKFSRMRFSGWGGNSKPYISNMKITTAAPDNRHKLITEGKMITYGINFDVNKDVVKPESHATIKDIADVMKEVAGLRIRITGHTDSDGDDARNLDLSKRRALSVKNYLVGQFGIAENRIETDGKGESEHLAPNTTAESKAKNRRVEITRL
jgi:outer membrane protein OmpA-like peptidoglycan-associated protein